jgi:uncharacterized membrane protein YhaH (DUF805 family)
MTLVEATKTCFAKYLTFSGRASRSEFWKFILFILIGLFICLFVNSMIFGPEIQYLHETDENGYLTGRTSVRKHYSSGVIGDVFLLGTLIPWLSVTWRRMHDSGRAGFLPFLPLVGWIILIFAIIIAHTGFSNFSAAIQSTGRVSVPASGTIGFVVLLAFILSVTINIYWLNQASAPQTNKYGPNPNEALS